MQFCRPAFAVHPTRFGRGPLRQTAEGADDQFALSSDLKLFAATFLCGFVFVSILIG